MIDHVIAVDWSGATRLARSDAGASLWWSEVRDGEVVALEPSDSRERVVDDLVARAGSPGLAVGLDFAFSFPEWFVRQVLEDVVPGESPDAFWRLVADRAEEWLARPAAPFWSLGTRAQGETGARAFRDTEREVAGAGASPKSTFQLHGPGQVGQSTLRGIPHLRRLREAGFAVWPFDAPAPDRPVVVEIYPRLFYGDLVKSSAEGRAERLRAVAGGARVAESILAKARANDNAFDALVSALGMWHARDRLALLPPARSARDRIEGRIWSPGVELAGTGDGPDGAPGDVSPDEFRRHGHALVDWIAGYLERPERFPVLAQVAPGEVRAALPASPPVVGESLDAILADVERTILPGITHWNHPAFFAYFATSASAPGILGELLTAALDVKAMLWKTSPAATELEQLAVDWLRQLLGLDDGWHGHINDTASISTMLAVAAARESHPELRVRDRGLAGRPDVPAMRVYCSAHAHSSVDKGAITLGLGHENVVKVGVDDALRMRPDLLARAIAEDRAAGRLPLAVVATAGTTSASSIDPVREIAAVCRAPGGAGPVWLHVDAAYGGSAAVAPEYRFVLDGAELADSLVVNPHKWLFVPMDCSVLYVRRPDIVRRAFSLVPEYLVTGEQDRVENLMDYGVQLGRRFRALKLWMVLRSFGAEGLAERIRYHVALAQEFAGWVRAEPGWEVAAPHPLSLVCFRWAPAGTSEAEREAVNARIMHEVNATGETFLSHTKLGERYVLRLAIGNIRTERRHVARAWELLRGAAPAASAEAPPTRS